MNHKRMRTGVIGCLVTVLLLVACGAPTPTPTPVPTSTPLPTPTPKPLTAQEILKAAQDALEAAGTYHFDMNAVAAVDVPSLGMQLDMPMLFAGDVQAPDQMQGSLTMTVLSTTMTTEMIVIGSEAWATDPTTGQWVARAESGAPVGPQQFTDLSESELAGMTLVGEETLDGEQVFHVTGTVDEELDLGAGLGGPMQLSLVADYWIAKESSLPVKASMEGSMPITQEGLEMTVGMSMTMEFSGYGEPVTIEPPPMATPTAGPAPTATAIPLDAMAGLNPSPRSYHVMAYDAESDRVILFDGGIGGVETYDTWAYDVGANTWTEMKPPSGPPGAGFSMTYDAESDRVIMYGGTGGSDENYEAWAYDYNTNTWTEMARGPVNHDGARMAYDAESDRIVLYGGFDWTTETMQYDTWAYDSNSDTWTEMEPGGSPPGLIYQGIAYDAESDRVLIWGGVSPDEEPLPPSVWSYDFNTNTWEEMKSGEGPQPQGADYTAMVYDAKADRTILYGGQGQGDETWAYDYNTNTWTQLTPPGTVPGDLSKHAMAYSTAADRVILFGGRLSSSGGATSVDRLNFGETWSYDFNTNTWTNVTPHR